VAPIKICVSFSSVRDKMTHYKDETGEVHYSMGSLLKTMKNNNILKLTYL